MSHWPRVCKRANLLAPLTPELPVPTPPRVLLAVRIPADLRRKIKVHAAKHGTTVAAFVIEAIRTHLSRRA